MWNLTYSDIIASFLSLSVLPVTERNIFHLSRSSELFSSHNLFSRLNIIYNNELNVCLDIRISLWTLENLFFHFTFRRKSDILTAAAAICILNYITRSTLYYKSPTHLHLLDFQDIAQDCVYFLHHLCNHIKFSCVSFKSL